MSALERRTQSLALFCVVAMTLVVTPWMNLDPINLPKFLILVVSGFALLGNFVPFLSKLELSTIRLLTIFALVFVFGLLLSLFTSGADINSQLYGAYGRNTGFLAYFSLAVISIGIAFVSSHDFVRKLILALIFTGTFNAIYGLAQWADLDPFTWNSSYSPIIGTLGNPNFISAHLGMATLASMSLLLGLGTSLLSRALLLFNIILFLFVIYQSDSSQGLLISALGATVVFYYRFVDRLRLKLLKSLYWCVVSGMALVGAFGTLNRGPLASFLYQDSVTFRGDYWRAGWKMTLDNPLFGVGLDSYGGWYRFSRSEAAALRRGPDVTSNSAHNVFLDISSNGGFFLLISYLLIISLVIRSAVRVLRKPGGFDSVSVGLVSSWLAYLVQSVISINQLGLAIWGWVLGGAIIGYDLYKDRPDLVQGRRKTGKQVEQVPPSLVLTGTLGLVIGIVVSIWPVIQDVSFRAALESGDGIQVERVTDKFPRSGYYYIYAGQIFQENNLEEKALKMARLAIEVNPRDFIAWELLAANSKISQEERDAAIAKMRELDPFNNTLGK